MSRHSSRPLIFLRSSSRQSFKSSTSSKSLAVRSLCVSSSRVLARVLQLPTLAERPFWCFPVKSTRRLNLSTSTSDSFRICFKRICALSERLSFLASLSRSLQTSSNCLIRSLFSSIDFSIKLRARSLDLSALSFSDSIRRLCWMSFLARLKRSAVLDTASSISDSALRRVPFSSTTVIYDDLFFSMARIDESSLRILVYSFSMSSIVDWNRFRSCSWRRSFCFRARSASESSSCKSKTWSRAFLNSPLNSRSWDSSKAISFLAFSSAEACFSSWSVSIFGGVWLSSETFEDMMFTFSAPLSNTSVADVFRTFSSLIITFWYLCRSFTSSNSFFSLFSLSLEMLSASWSRLFARLRLSNRSSSSHLSFSVLRNSSRAVVKLASFSLNSCSCSNFSRL